MKTTFLFLFFLPFLVSCSKKTAPAIIVDPEFQPYVESFIEEAANRGVDIDFEKTGLSIIFGETPANANGVCTGVREGISSSHEIIIHRNRWKEDNEFDKERLIFHELGHCHLFLGHTSDTLANGEWKSIMRGESPIGFGFRSFNLTGIRRDYYFDELFNSNIPQPDWGKIAADYNAIPESQKEVLLEVENRGNFFRSTDLSGNFEIEIKFLFTENFINNSLGFSWGGFGQETSMAMTLYRTNLFIINRLEGYGILRAFESFNGLKLNEINSMTVQKIENRYYHFINERFIYWSEVEPLQSNVVEINQNEVFDFKVAIFTVKKLLL